MKSIYLTLSLIIAFLIILSSCAQKSKLPPNIIVIQADDLGFSDLAIHGNPYVESPAIDNLAKSGIQYTQFYVNSVCAPTRASLLTGRHFLRTGVSHVHGGKDFIHLSETLLPEALKENGYVTGMWGKWHSGKTAGYFPWERGFDEAYMAQLYKHENSRGLLNGKETAHEKWASEVITDYAIDFIKRNQQPNKPFFAYLSYLTVHAPLQAPAHLIEKYEEKGLSKNLSTLYGMIDQMDSCIRVLVNEVKMLGLAENTVILFMSDNGPAVINNLLTDEDRQIRYVNNYKGHKGNLWENGVKSPLFIRWNGTAQPGISNQLLDVTDLYPTLVALAGGKYPESQLPLDGIDFSELIKGKQTALNKTVFNWVNPGWPPTSRPWSPEGIEGEYQPINSESRNKLVTNEQLISIHTTEGKLLQNAADYENTPDPVNNFVEIDIQNDPKETVNLHQGNDLPPQADELHNWFNAIKGSPHAFSSPVFQIGKNKSEILGYGPEKISEGLTNTSFYLSGWEQGNQQAEYDINVTDAGTYKAELFFREEFPVNLNFVLSANGNHASFKKEGNRYLSGNLMLKKGHQTIRLQATKNDRNDSKNPVRLSAIHLKLSTQ